MKDRQAPLVSIIVPVYNAEKYLNRCVDSILSQTMTDFELLLIDDGSKDNSGRICDEYSEKDARVRVFHKPNGGVSSARNLGLDNARGEWITFVDADDVIRSCFSDIDWTMLSEDLICFPSYSIYDDSTVFLNSIERRDGIYIPAKSFYSGILFEVVLRTTWSKLFKHSLIADLRFDENIKIGEDQLFNLQYLHKTKSIRYKSDIVFYDYYSMGDAFVNKYKLSTDYSIYILRNLFESYWKLGISDDVFEVQAFLLFKQLCQEAIYEEHNLWYGDEFVQALYDKLRNKLPLEFRIKYYLMSMALFNYIKRLLIR